MHLSSNFLSFVEDREYMPEYWCEERIMSSRSWIFDDFAECEGMPSDEKENWLSKDGRPPWWKELPNIKSGFGNNIDNCVGEFTNYHHAIADFFQSRNPNCKISFLEENWIDVADLPQSLTKPIQFQVNNRVLQIKRKESTLARKNTEGLESFLSTVENNIQKLCNL